MYGIDDAINFCSINATTLRQIHQCDYNKLMGFLRALLRFTCFSPYEQHFQDITSFRTSAYGLNAGTVNALPTQGLMERIFQHSRILSATWRS